MAIDKSIYNLRAISYVKRKKAKAERKREKKAAQQRYSERARSSIQYVPYVPKMGADFYSTREWRSLRWKVLVASDGRCVMCGASRASGAIMHVDHILPRSKRPDLELHQGNLQVMCADCNIGKGSKSY